MITDSHAHIYSEYYADIDFLIKGLTQVKTIINSGVDTSTNKEILELSSKYENMYITLGIHPENVSNYSQCDIDFIEQNLNNNKVIAIGEIGLDYHYENPDINKQIILFTKQLELAQKHNLPIVVHSRDATFDTIKLLKKYNLKGVIHSFSGSKETALEYIKMGYKLGINGVVTFKSAKIKDVIKEIGLEHFILETDSPYLTPEPNRGKQNNPDNVYYIAKFLSDFLLLDIEDIVNITNRNVASIFDIQSL